MISIKLLAVVTPPSIYYGCSSRKTFWEKNFTGEEKFTLGEFTDVNMIKYDCCNVRKHRVIKDSDNYITMYISLKFGILEKIRITYSDPKDNL